MKRGFLFDLNVIRFVATLKNEKGEEDYSSKQLLVGVINACNPVFVPVGYPMKYLRIWSDLKRRGEFLDTGVFTKYGSRSSFLQADRDEILTNVNTAITDINTAITDINIAIADIAEVEEMGEYDDDEEDLVRLAAHVDNGIVMVTTDDRLRNKLNELGMPEKYGFKIMRPEDAIKYVGDIE